MSPLRSKEDPQSIVSSKKPLNVYLWPTPVINDAEIYTYRMVALWPGPEPVSTDGSLAAVDPKENVGAILGWWLLQTR